MKSSNNGLESESVFIGITNTSYKDENDFLRNIPAQVLIKRVVLYSDRCQ